MRACVSLLSSFFRLVFVALITFQRILVASFEGKTSQSSTLKLPVSEITVFLR